MFNKKKVYSFLQKPVYLHEYTYPVMQTKQGKTRQRLKIDFIPIFDIVQKDRLIIKNTHQTTFGDLFYYLLGILNVMQTVNPQYSSRLPNSADSTQLVGRSSSVSRFSNKS